MRKLFLLPAALLFVLSLDLLTGQNLLHFHHLGDSKAALLGMVLEFVAFGLVVVSKAQFVTSVACGILVLQSPLLIGWGVLVGMFSGWGDGASRGASASDVLIWFLGGILSGLLGLVLLIYQLGKSRPS